MMRFGLVIVALMLCAAPDAAAQWQPDPDDKKQVAVQAAIDRVKARIPRSHPFFADAHGWAVLPAVTRFGFGFGGAYGSGLVFERERLIGSTGFWQFTSGIQAGVRNFSMIIFFRDAEALQYFRQRKLQFLGQAGVAVANVGVAGTPAYNDGVAIITVTRLGLMGEFTVSGAKFTYKDLPEE